MLAMVGQASLTDPDVDREAAAVAECPRCGKPASPVPPVCSEQLGAVALHRCQRCGTRYTAEADPPRTLTVCSRCGRQSLAEPRDGGCPDCRSERFEAEADPALVEATEREIRSAMDRCWTFLDDRSLSTYLDAHLRRVARQLGAPFRACEVVVLDDESQRTLALPSGTVLLSLGALAALEDEAELVFVLAHELAHATSAAAVGRLVRLGLAGAARESCDEAQDAWAVGARELVRIGFGDSEELEADRRALEAVSELGYDPQSVVRYLKRIRVSIGAGEAGVSDLALAHPPLAERLKRVENALSGKVGGDSESRVNREVFRRLVRKGRLQAEESGARKLDPEPEPANAPTRRSRPWIRVAVLVFLLALVAMLLLR